MSNSSWRRTLWALLAACAVLVSAAPSRAATHVVSDSKGWKLQVDGRDFMVFGMNWGHMPIGQNYTYDLWSQPDDVIIEALAREMPLMKAMGVNAIRQYNGIPARWIEYIYDHYGIYTMLNHPCGRYGFTLDGVYIAHADYGDPKLREGIKAEVVALVDEFKGTRGLLMWLLGNENNYGLSWTSFEAEALPQGKEGEEDRARARQLYSMFDEITRAIQAADKDHPVAICNGDVQYIDIIGQECKTVDVFGTNQYRGISARDLYAVVKNVLGIPVMYTEFGSDAYNAKEMREDQPMQARYLIGQWKEIYEMSYGKGRVGNAIGGFVFQWSDGWWKFGQDSRLDIHDTNASWPDGGYSDYVEGQNNMNEEWWGICAKGYPDDRFLYDVYPRAAYYAMQQAFELDPYANGTDIPRIERHFGAIDPFVSALKARSDRAALMGDTDSKVRLSGLRMEFETYNTGGSNISTPPTSSPQQKYPSYLGFDYMQSFYTDFEAKPAENLTGNLSLNILGRVPVNPIDEIFYENRGRTRTVIDETTGDIVRLEGIERVKVYNASVSWDDQWFRLDAFYRTGHTHWGYEGDFFGLYREAYYGDAIDVYNANTPLGVELAGKRRLEGLNVVFGPEVYWGANPSILLKYSRNIKGVDATAIYQDEFSQLTDITTTNVIPAPKTRRATLDLKRSFGDFTAEVGGIWAGSTLVGEEFQIAEETPGGGMRILRDEVKDSDTFGVKARLSWESGRWHWYGQTAYEGIVTFAGPEYTQNFTRWMLRDTGQGNGTNFVTGVAANFGRWQIAPNFIYQKPLVGPIPGDAPSPGRPRNRIDDPFLVRENREMTGAEIVFSFDPTPATWMWQWDNDIREDARFASALGFVFRSFKTTMDASIYFDENGNSFPFPGATPARDVWEAWYRVASKIGFKTRIVANLYGGNGEPRGEDTRLIQRYGGTVRATYDTYAFEGALRFKDWGPYDYHRDFNLTFPVQITGDISKTFGHPRWFSLPQTRFGVRGTYRSLDQHSPRYCPGMTPDANGNLVCDPTLPGDNGTEWELRTYLHFSI